MTLWEESCQALHTKTDVQNEFKPQVFSNLKIKHLHLKTLTKLETHQELSSVSCSQKKKSRNKTIIKNNEVLKKEKFAQKYQMPTKITSLLLTLVLVQHFSGVQLLKGRTC